MRKLFLLFIILSCSKPVKWSKEDLLKKAQQADPSISIILPKTMADGISCDVYSEGCLAGHIVSLRGLNFIAVEFSTEEQAINAAKKYRGYYTRNWLLDDVTGEPALEDFAQKSLEAKKP